MWTGVSDNPPNGWSFLGHTNLITRDSELEQDLIQIWRQLEDQEHIMEPNLHLMLRITGWNHLKKTDSETNSKINQFESTHTYLIIWPTDRSDLVWHVNIAQNDKHMNEISHVGLIPDQNYENFRMRTSLRGRILALHPKFSTQLHSFTTKRELPKIKEGRSPGILAMIGPK